MSDDNTAIETRLNDACALVSEWTDTLADLLAGDWPPNREALRTVVNALRLAVWQARGKHGPFQP